MNPKTKRKIVAPSAEAMALGVKVDKLVAMTKETLEACKMSPWFEESIFDRGINEESLAVLKDRGTDSYNWTYLAMRAKACLDDIEKMPSPTGEIK